MACICKKKNHSDKNRTIACLELELDRVYSEMNEAKRQLEVAEADLENHDRWIEKLKNLLIEAGKVLKGCGFPCFATAIEEATETIYIQTEDDQDDPI